MSSVGVWFCCFRKIGAVAFTDSIVIHYLLPQSAEQVRLTAPLGREPKEASFSEGGGTRSVTEGIFLCTMP